MSNPDIQDLLEQAIRAGNLEQAKQALEAGARTEGTEHRPPALATAIFFNPRNRLHNGVTREWCEWMGLDPEKYAQKPYCKVVETPKAGQVYDFAETYPNLEMVELLLQYGADPNLSFAGTTILTLVLNHKFLNVQHDQRYREYQETLETLVYHLLPSARLLNLNHLVWDFPRMHASLLEKVWNQVVLHQIEQPGLRADVLKRLLEHSKNQNETLRQLITLKGLRWEHFQNLPKCIDVLPSVRTLEFAKEHVFDSSVEQQRWDLALGNLLTVAAHRKYWLYVGDLLRLGALPDVLKLDANTIGNVIEVYPKEYLNKPAGRIFLSDIMKVTRNNRVGWILERIVLRGAEPNSALKNLGVIQTRPWDFRYVLALAQVAHLDPAKVNWTANDAENNLLYLFKKLPKDLQQHVIKVGFMAPVKNKTTQEFQAPSSEHATKTFLKLKENLPMIEENVRVQRNANKLLRYLRLRHKTLIDHSVPIDFRSDQGPYYRKRTGFYTLFHGNRAANLAKALSSSKTLHDHLQVINHQLSFYPGEKIVTVYPYASWNRSYSSMKATLTRSFKRYPFKSRIGYYGLLKALKQETEAAIRYSQQDAPMDKIQNEISNAPFNKRVFI